MCLKAQFVCFAFSCGVILMCIKIMFLGEQLVILLVLVLEFYYC